jgi:hypothetical protein
MGWEIYQLVSSVIAAEALVYHAQESCASENQERALNENLRLRDLLEGMCLRGTAGGLER